MTDTTANKTKVTGVETTGHSWDGIEELNNPLPRWWLWTLYATIIWGMWLYDRLSGLADDFGRDDPACWAIRPAPKWPLKLQRHEAQNEGLVAELIATDMTTRWPHESGSEPLCGCARWGGVSAHCSPVPWFRVRRGPKAIPTCWTMTGCGVGTWLRHLPPSAHGIRNEADDDARYSEMPAFGEILESGGNHAVVEYVVSLSTPSMTMQHWLAEQGAVVFADNCASCHGDDGLGVIANRVRPTWRMRSGCMAVIVKT